MDMSDGAPEPDLIINHLNQNHYSSDSEADHPSDLQDNHMAADPQGLRQRVNEEEEEEQEERENGRHRAGEPPLGLEGGAEMVLMDEQIPRYLSPAALKKHIHTETTKVNNELRTLITKEIRKPGRRTYPAAVF